MRILVWFVLFSAPLPLLLTATPAHSAENPRIEAALGFLRGQMGPRGLLDSYVEDGTDRAYTYDNALAAMAFLYSGDLSSARTILEAFKTIGPQPEGGFLECYHAQTGKPYGTLTGGPNAYLLQAMNLYYAKSQDPRYNLLARQIGDYLLSLQDEDGGLFGRAGVRWKSTENNLGAFSALYNLGTLQENPDLLNNARKIRHFLTAECWEGTYFLRGKNDPTIVTDAQALGVLALGKDYFSGLSWVEKEVRVRVEEPDHSTITGLDFDWDQDTIWTEGTLQAALAFQIAQDPTRSAYYRSEAEKLIHPSGALLLAPRPGTTGIDWTLARWQAAAPTAWYLFLCYEENILRPLR